MEPIYVDVRTSTVAGQLSRVPAVMSHAGPERIAGSAPTLRVYVLGELRVEIPDGDRDRAWLRSGDDELRSSATSPAVQRPEQIEAGLQKKLEQLHAVADRIYDRWTQGLSRAS